MLRGLETAAWVEIYRGQDTLMVHMLGGALETQGFVVRLHGSLSGAAIGAGEGAASAALLVRGDQAAEAAATLEEMMGEVGGEEGLLSLFEEDAEAGELSFEGEAGEGALSDVTDES